MNTGNSIHTRYNTILALMRCAQATTGAECDAQAIARKDDGVLALREGTSEITCLKMLLKR